MEAFDSDEFVQQVLGDARTGRADSQIGPILAWQRWWREQWQDGADDPIAAVARDQGFVLSTAQAAALGLSANDIRRELRRGRLNAPARGVLTPISGTDDDDLLLARRRAALAATAAALLRPGQVITGRSGAVLHGLPMFALPDRPQLTARQPATLGRRSRTQIYSAALPPRDILSWFGAPVANTQRTLVDLARHDRRDAIMAADAALRAGLVTRAQLALPVTDAFGWPYSRQARDLLALADPRSESPFESIVRLALHDDGFPTPELQYWIGPYRVDFFWPEFRFVLEADGRTKYEKYADDDRNPMWREKRRETQLRRYDVHVERVVPADILTAAAWLKTSQYLRSQMRRFSPGPVKFRG